MTTLTEQVDDWQKLRNILIKTKHYQGQEQLKLRQEFYEGVRAYWLKYHDKFDFNNKPRCNE